jgi:hypothetical protein
MPRYNTIYPVASRDGVGTIQAPSTGQFVQLTGTAPYTITLPMPSMFPGAHQSFYNSTGGTVTLSTPAGTIRMAGADATTFAMGADSFVSLASDGTDYMLYVNTGGYITATGGLFTGPLSVNGANMEGEYGRPWTVQATNTTVVDGGRYLVNTGATALTLTLPTGSAVGAVVHFIDYGRTFNVRALTVGNNGQRIMGSIDTMTVNTQGAAFSLVWSGTTNGWLITHGI